MYLRRATIENIRSFTQLEWDLREHVPAGWHVIIGDNGAGKTSFLRCLAMSICGSSQLSGLRENWRDWCNRESDTVSKSGVTAYLEPDEAWDKFGRRNELLPKQKNLKSAITFESSQKVFGGSSNTNTVWGKTGNKGFFSAGYGPFRRFTGGDREQEKLFLTHPALARHLSLFGEDVALTMAIDWIRDLRFEELDQIESSGSLLKSIRNFVNQPDFLPHGVELKEVSSKGVIFNSPEGKPIEITKLSDGYRTILSMTLELIRQLSNCFSDHSIFKEFPDGSSFVEAPGIVLIDEIDAHLHPTWQRKIGQWLTKHFPRIQFIVTTHSPLICQAAKNGTIFRLPAPGSDQDKAGFVTGVDRERLIYGDVLDAYGTALFGAEVERADEAKLKMAELSKLNQKALNTELTAAEVEERKMLKQVFAAHSDSPF